VKVQQEAFAGTLVVATLTTFGLWYAGLPDFPVASPPEICAVAPASSPPLVIYSLDWTRDGVIALGTHGSGGTLSLFAPDRWLPRSLNDTLAGVVSCASLAADGRHLLAGTHDGRLWWIDLDEPESPRELVASSPSPITAAAITHDARLIAAGTLAGSIYLCDPSTETLRVLHPDRESRIGDLHFSRDRKWLASAHNDGSVRLWEVASATRSVGCARHDDVARAVAFLPDSERLISAGLDDTIRIWDLARREETWREKAGQHGVSALAVSPDGSTAAWGGYDHTIVLWNLDDDEIELEIDIPASQVTHLKFSPDGSFLLADGGIDAEGTIYLYDLRRGGEEKRISLLPPASAKDP
jgi:WD40 repeat protein